MLPPNSDWKPAPILPSTLRERTVRPRTRPRYFVTRWPSISLVVVTSMKGSWVWRADGRGGRVARHARFYHPPCPMAWRGFLVVARRMEQVQVRDPPLALEIESSAASFV